VHRRYLTTRRGLRIKAQFTLGVKANVQLKSSISIGAKVETSPKGFTQGIKVETKKIF
jgi:hypothetical protein